MKFESLILDLLLPATADASASRWQLAENGQTRTLTLSIPASAGTPLTEMLEWFAQEAIGFPLISVSPALGLTVWIVLQHPIPVEGARTILEDMRQHFFSSLKADEVVCEASEIQAVPLTLDGSTWSAWIDPTMVAMFRDETWLEVPPNLEQQAMLVAQVGAVAPDQLQQLLSLDPTLVENLSLPIRAESTLSPRDFLMAAMNNPVLPMSDRIAAAAALLPYAEHAS